MPADMVALIADYENGLKGRIYAIVNDLVQSKALEGTRPAYMFLKAPSSVIGTGETILIPHGRTELDWEIELATVIGRRGRGMSPRRRHTSMCSATPSCSTSRTAAGGRLEDSAAAPTGS
jgi:hypothetical protein